MTPRLPVRLALPLALGFAALPGSSQQLIGYINTHDATITGSTDELDGRAVLMGSASVTAKDHTAPISLSRGGTVSVCQTSVLHVTESREMSVAAPLLFSLDRGAVEIQTGGTPNDAIMTPDLRFTVRNKGPLDLRLRVARNGDTCVENRGPGAPTLSVTDPFGASMYELAAGQHVLFEHGSLREVVDHETTPCGCPEPKGLNVADALLATNTGSAAGAKTVAPVPVPAESAHPFPAAISEGLAQPEDLPPLPAPSQTPPQISEPLVYMGVTKDPDALSQPDHVQKPKLPSQPAAPVATVAIAAPAVQIAPVAMPEPPPPVELPPPPVAAAPKEQNNDVAHVVGRLFRRMFGKR